MAVAFDMETSLDVVKMAPSKILEVLRTYSTDAAAVRDKPVLVTSGGQEEKSGTRSEVKAELAELKQRTITAIQRLEDATSLALADARSQLESAFFPTLSTDPQVHRVFELRQTRALARVTSTLDRAGSAPAALKAIRQLADEASKKCDWATLRILRWETTPYLIRRRMDSAVEGAVACIEEAVVAARPKSAPALNGLQDFERGAARVALAFEQVREAVESGKRTVRVMGFGPKDVDSVSLPKLT